MNKVVVDKDDDQIRIERWFQRHYKSVPHALIARLIRKGLLKINNKKAAMGTKIKTGDLLSFPNLTILPKNKPDDAGDNNYNNASLKGKELESIIKKVQDGVIFMDEDIIVINKPAGIAVQDGTKVRFSIDSLSEYLRYGYDQKPKLVHRLDKETSGVLILARKTSVAAALAEAFKHRNMKKFYVALVYGCPKVLQGTIDIPLEKTSSSGFEKATQSKNGKRAITKYRVIDRMANSAALLELDLVTGRTHQIRAHLAMINCPIVGDKKYQNKNIAQFKTKQLFLHAQSISFNLNGKNFAFKAPLPLHFEEALKFYGLNSIK